jgi:flagellar hook-basal body complex protein FliE
MATSAFAAGAYAAAQSIARPGATPKPMQTAATGNGFGSMLTQALDSVAQSGAKADAQTLSAASGKANVVDVVTAVAESETALQTLVAVRDRVISAYEDIMKMPI